MGLLLPLPASPGEDSVLRFDNSEIYEDRDAMVDFIWHRLHPEDQD